VTSLRFQRRPLYSSGSVFFVIFRQVPRSACLSETHLQEDIIGEILPRDLHGVKTLIQILKYPRRTHPTANAHRDHPELYLAAFHLIDDLHG
jgi:hypothetical protein